MGYPEDGPAPPALYPSNLDTLVKPPMSYSPNLLEEVFSEVH
jgi:hypothetical protein